MGYTKDVYDLLAQLPGRHPHLEHSWWLHDSTPKIIQSDGEVERPEWLGPRARFEKLSQVPGELADAYEIALHDELFVARWRNGDAYLQLTSKGRVVLTEAASEAEAESGKPPADAGNGHQIEADLATPGGRLWKWPGRVKAPMTECDRYVASTEPTSLGNHRSGPNC